MKQKVVSIGDINVANDLPFVLFGGMNVLESRDLAMRICEHYVTVTQKLGIPYVFKASFDKANRSSIHSYRGPGLEEGMKIFQELKQTFGVKIITDVHEASQAQPVADVVDVLQTPAFLCRQTDFIRAVAQSGKPVNIKKGQFLAPADMKNVIEKARSAAAEKGLPTHHFLACERGVSFGYNNLISDMRGLAIMRHGAERNDTPVVFDATHSVQLPGGQGSTSGGQREFVPVLARAAVATGISGIFMETHPNPSEAWSDGPNAVPLNRMKELLTTLKALDSAVKSGGMFLEDNF